MEWVTKTSFLLFFLLLLFTTSSSSFYCSEAQKCLNTAKVTVLDIRSMLNTRKDRPFIEEWWLMWLGCWDDDQQACVWEPSAVVWQGELPAFALAPAELAIQKHAISSRFIGTTLMGALMRTWKEPYNQAYPRQWWCHQLVLSTQKCLSCFQHECKHKAILSEDILYMLLFYGKSSFRDIMSP